MAFQAQGDFLRLVFHIKVISLNILLLTEWNQIILANFEIQSRLSKSEFCYNRCPDCYFAGFDQIRGFLVSQAV